VSRKYHIRHWISLNRVAPHPKAYKEYTEWYVDLTPEEVIALAEECDVMVLHCPGHKCGDWYLDVDHKGKHFRMR